MPAVLWPAPWVAASYVLLLLAISSLMLTRQGWAWGGLLALSLTTGLMGGSITWLALPWVALLAGSAWWALGDRSPNLDPTNSQARAGGRGLAGFVLFSTSATLMIHKAPGFASHQLLDGIRLGTGTPYDLYMNADKPLIGLFILAFGAPLIRREEWRSVLRHLGFAAALALPTLLAASWALGFVRVDPKLPEIFWLWAPRNLLMTCVAEEALFRGLLQDSAQRCLGRWAMGDWLALVAVSLFFGLAHLAGGWPYAVLSTVAGMFYGFAYLKTGRIEASILLHFAVNTFHFLFFTYPAAG